MSLAPGARLGAYEIVSAIGAGGMGEVYRAKDPRLRRDVAIKVLPAAVASDADRLRRFEQEALATAALNHPNILSVHDVGKDGDTAYVVLELLEGRTLREAMAAGALPVRKAAEFAAQIANGLAAAHAKGIVHRDLKPENVFVTDDERVKILDFGLARIGDAAGTTSTVLGGTEPGTVLGTIGYMAPEQVRGVGVDHRSDIFSFGAILYELLSGRRAFAGDTPADTMTAILKEAPPELSESGRVIPPALERVVRRCLEKNPAVRFQSASDLAFALNLDPSSATTSGVAAAAPAEPRTRRPLAVAGLVAGALAIGTAAGFFAHDTLAPGSARITDVSYQPVTFDTGFVFAARFAKDTRTVVYSADWEGRARDLFVTSLDSRESRPLGLAGADLLGLAPSGDLAILAGSAIAPGGNSYRRRGTLARSSLTGAATREVLADVTFADVGPDGDVAAIRQSGIEQLLEFPVGQVVARGATFVTPRISPDGSHVAVMTVFPGAGIRLQVFRRAGGLVIEDQEKLNDWWGLAWRGPDEIWFAGVDESNSLGMFAFSLAGRRRLLYRAPGDFTLHDVSPGGDVLASFDRSTSRVELVDARGELRDLTWQDVGFMDLSNTGVVLRNQFVGGAGPEGSVMVWPPGASQPVRISSGLGLAISPDGSTVLVREDKTLKLVPVGPGRPRTLDIGALQPAGWAGWHPDGRVILQVQRADGTRSTVAVPPSGGPPVTVLPADLELMGGQIISPDGAHIVALGRDGGLRLCALTGGTCVAMPGSRLSDQMCGWTADSRSVIVRQGGAVPDQLETLDISTGRRAAWKTVRPKHPALNGIRYLMVAPNGSMLYNYSWARTDLYVIRGLR